jgi:hypothetical protein
MFRFKLSAHIALALVLSAGIFSPAYADIFKYVDSDGTIHFSNVPQSKQTPRVVKEGTGGKSNGVEIVSRHFDRARAASYNPDGETLSDGVPYAEIINAKCQKYSVDPVLVKSIIKTESNFNPTAVSSKGAKGLMQLMPSTAADMGVSDLFDPDQNIEGGVKYFRYLLDNFGGDLELSIAAYNCGEGRVYRNGNCVPDIPETKNYVKKVLRFTQNPITGMTYSRPIYRIEMKDGSIMFSDTPVPASVGVNVVQ